MTSDELDAALERIGWTSKQLAGALGCSHTIPYRWRFGAAAIPEPVARWLTKLAKCHDNTPPPTDWRQR